MRVRQMWTRLLASLALTAASQAAAGTTSPDCKADLDLCS